MADRVGVRAGRVDRSADGRVGARGRQARARLLGIPFDGTPGALDAITDVAGLEVGYTTLISGEGPLKVGVGPVRTGVTAILPRGHHDTLEHPVFAAGFSLNGNGEMTGMEWVEEGGFLEGPVMLTNTHSVGTVRDAVIKWRVAQGAADATGYWWSLPVVAETYDGYLNDVNGFHVRDEHVFHALDSAAPGPVAEGAVGGGTGMICYEFKGRHGHGIEEARRQGRRLHGRRARPGQLRTAQATDGCGCPGRPGDHGAVGLERGNGVHHHCRGDRRPAVAPSTQAPRAAGDHRTRAHRQHLGQRLGRHFPGVLHGQFRRRQDRRHGEAGDVTQRPHQPAFRGNGPGHGGSDHQRDGRRRADGRARRAPRPRRSRTKSCGRFSASTGV